MVNRKWLNRKWLRDWSLPLSMILGASAYFLCQSLQLSTSVKEAALEGVAYVQPTLIFCMLTLTFCRIRLQDMRLRGWQWWLLAFQAVVAALLCLLHQMAEDQTSRLFLQSTMLCFLCPTATAGDKGTVPYYTGNLLDSIGVRILKGNTLMQYRTMTEMTTKHATKPQSMGGVRNIWGDEELMRRINRPSRRQGKGVVAQLMVGVPYAESVDQTHDYFGELKDRFVNGVSRDLERLRQRKYIVG